MVVSKSSRSKSGAMFLVSSSAVSHLSLDVLQVRLRMGCSFNVQKPYCLWRLSIVEATCQPTASTTERCVELWELVPDIFIWTERSLSAGALMDNEGSRLTSILCFHKHRRSESWICGRRSRCRYRFHLENDHRALHFQTPSSSKRTGLHLKTDHPVFQDEIRSDSNRP